MDLHALHLLPLIFYLYGENSKGGIDHGDQAKKQANETPWRLLIILYLVPDIPEIERKVAPVGCHKLVECGQYVVLEITLFHFKDPTSLQNHEITVGGHKIPH